MKISLATIPTWFPNQPYLSIPLLTGILRGSGYAVTQKDINLSFFDNLLTKEELTCQYDYFKQNNNQPIEQKYELLIETKEYFLSEIQTHKNIVRQLGNYQNISVVTQSFQEIDLALKIFGLNFPDTILSMGNVEYTFNHLNAKSAIEFACKDNIFSYYFKKYELADYIEQQPDVIGFSVISPEQLIPALSFARVLKNNLTGIQIVLGGAYISKVGYFLMQYSTFNNLIDFVLCGNTEKSILAFFDVINNKSNDFSKVSALIYNKQNKIVKTAERINVKELYDGIAFPNFEGLPLDKYFFPVVQLPVEISKACYWGKCKFCELQGLQYVEKKDDLIFNELHFLSEKYGANYFSFVSASPSPKLLHKVATKIFDNKLNIKWTSMIRVENCIDETFAKELFNGGMRVAMIGFESGSQSVLDKMDKGEKIECNEMALQTLSKAGINIHAYFMLGFDGETDNDVVQTSAFVNRNETYIDSIACSYYSPINQYYTEENISIYAENQQNKIKINKFFGLLKRSFDYPLHLNTLILSRNMDKIIRTAFDEVVNVWNKHNNLAFWKNLAENYYCQDKELIDSKRIISKILFYPSLITKLLENSEIEKLEIMFFSTLLPRHYWNFPIAYDENRDLFYGRAFPFLDTYRNSITKNGNDKLVIKRVLIIRSDISKEKRRNEKEHNFKYLNSTFLFPQKELNKDKTFYVTNAKTTLNNHFTLKGENAESLYFFDFENHHRKISDLIKYCEERRIKYNNESKKLNEAELYDFPNEGKTTLLDYYIDNLHCCPDKAKYLIIDDKIPNTNVKLFDEISLDSAKITIKKTDKTTENYILDVKMDLERDMISIEIYNSDKENYKKKSKNMDTIFNKAKCLRTNKKVQQTTKVKSETTEPATAETIAKR